MFESFVCCFACCCLEPQNAPKTPTRRKHLFLYISTTYADDAFLLLSEPPSSNQRSPLVVVRTGSPKFQILARPEGGRVEGGYEVPTRKQQFMFECHTHTSRYLVILIVMFLLKKKKKNCGSGGNLDERLSGSHLQFFCASHFECVNTAVSCEVDAERPSSAIDLLLCRVCLF